jgi:hypothetical protein
MNKRMADLYTKLISGRSALPMRNHHLLIAGGLAAALTGCALDDPDAPLGETEQAIVSDNGISLNGISLNGISLNGISLNGISLNGISLNGISLNGISLNGISLNGISLNGISLNGSAWTGSLSNGSTLALRVDGVVNGTGANADVGLYTVSVQTDGGWAPLCGTDAAGTPIQALAVDGLWNLQQGVAGGGAYTPSTTQFTFACRGKSIAKCVELGYKPWTGHGSHLAACVRMLRADICGNGTSFTVDGTPINLYDNVGIQADSETSWDIEAEWTADGARCLAKVKDTRFYRVLGMTTAPTCFTGPIDKTCGTFSAGALLVNEINK